MWGDTDNIIALPLIYMYIEYDEYYKHRVLVHQHAILW